jgi:23S rRNA pseudouridine2605 synthase
MAKRNTSGSSSGRRGTSRTSRGEGSFSSGKKSSDKPFRKSSSKPSSGRSSSFNKEERPLRKKKEGFEERPASRASFKKTAKPFNRREEGGSESGRGFKKAGRSYPKRDGGSSEGGTRSYGNKRSSYSKDTGEGRGYKKPGGSYAKRDEGSSEGGARSYGNKRSSYSKDTGEGRGYKKPGGSSYAKRDGGSSAGSGRSYGNKRSSYSKDTGEGRGGYKKPGRSYTRKDEGSSDEGTYNEKRGAYTKDSGGGRFKKFNTVDSGKSSARRNDSRSEGPSKERFTKKPSGKSYDRPDRGGKSPRDRKGFSDKEESAGFFKKAKSRYNSKEGKRSADEAAPTQTDKVRLNKFIANSGVCSRREADNLITMGLISVNGKTISELGYKVNPGDEVRYENKVLKAEKPVYILMNKPKGFLTTTEDPQERNTVMHIIGSNVKERIYPVGRLDRNTTGLLLLTNDGDLADKLMHPSYNIKKIYKVELDRPLTKADFQKITEGIPLEEGRAMVDDLAIVSEDGKTIGVELHIGWNRVVRRIFESLTYEVVRLDRSVYAGLDKKELARGQWRFLTKEEIVRLKHFG